ncbi:hypothetical protein ACOMHN_001758 [Nucella lapillus]
MKAMQEKMARMQSILDTQQTTIEDQRAALEGHERQRTENPYHQTPLVVNVKVPTQPPKLGILTGLKPTGGQEVGYTEWKDKVDSYLLEGPEEGEAFKRLIASLKGLAIEQVKKCRIATDITSTLKKIYGEVQTGEDRYLDFVKLQLTKGEKPSDFFTRVWDKFVFINQDVHSEYNVEEVVSTLAPKQNGEKDNVFSGSAQCTEGDVPRERDQTTDFKFRFGEGAPKEWCDSFRTKLQSFGDVFIKSEFDIGRVNTGEKFDIEVEQGPQIKQRARPIAPRDFEDCRRHIQGLLDARIIRPSNSPHASPIVLCRKKNFDLRMVCDYRVLNSRTIKDSYSVPKIEDLIVTLSGARFFTSMDLCKAFYHVPMTERASRLSAFITPFGLFEWDRLSQGLVNAPASFQRIMETVFRDMNLVELIIFLDDLLIHAGTLDELEGRTVKVLERLRRFNLKLDPVKCVFGTTEIKHLGFVFSEGSVRPDPDKTSAIKTWPKPKTVKEVKSLVGFANVYRRFIPDFSGLVRPLNVLTVGYIPQKGRSQKKPPGALSLSSDITSSWGEEQEEAFDKLKEALTSDLVIGIADKTKPFYLHCDASGTGLGAILYQEIDGKMKVIAYASQGLNRSEQNYPAHKREFLALKWAMSDKFSDYLLGSTVTVVTDNNPLCYILKNAKIHAGQIHLKLSKKIWVIVPRGQGVNSWILLS